VAHCNVWKDFFSLYSQKTRLSVPVAGSSVYRPA